MVRALIFITILIGHIAWAKPNCNISLSGSYESATQEIREDGLNADLIYPKDCVYKKTIIFFGGSEGGINTRLAKRLAQLGYGVYVLGYFNLEKSRLPENLVQIPIEYFIKAIGKIQTLNTDADCCYLIGGSKGAEAILTLLSLTGETYKGAVLLSGADRAMEGLGANNRPAQKSSWFYQNKDVPFTPMDGLSVKELLTLAWNFFKVPPSLRNMYLRSIENKKTGTDGLLPIKNINTEVLFLSGEDDNLWPSTIMGKNLEVQFKQVRKESLFKHISYPGVGHAIIDGHIALEHDANKKFLGGN